MAKRLSEKEKEEIVELFKVGIDIEELANRFKSTKLTIDRNLKKILGVKKFKELSHKKISCTQSDYENKEEISLENKNESHLTNSQESSADENFQNADGSITVPDVLHPYLGGMTRIEKFN